MKKPPETNWDPCSIDPGDREQYVICFGVDSYDAVLLYDKTNGPDAARGLNVPGGKVLPGENPAAAASREWSEEVKGAEVDTRWMVVGALDFEAVVVWICAARAHRTLDTTTVEGKAAMWSKPELAEHLLPRLLSGMNPVKVAYRLHEAYRMAVKPTNAVADTSDANDIRRQKALVSTCIPHLKWRHNGLGCMQAYLVERENYEARVHIWHPSLKAPGIDDSGSMHDHRFDLESTVLYGSLVHQDLRAVKSPWGWLESVVVDNYRSGGVDLKRQGKLWGVMPREQKIWAGQSYRFPHGMFHQTLFDDLVITIVEKHDTRDRKARLLSPPGAELVHASSWKPNEEVVTAVLNMAVSVL